jgi:hypothetical protein
LGLGRNGTLVGIEGSLFFGRERRVTQTPDVADAQSPKKSTWRRFSWSDCRVRRRGSPTGGLQNWRTTGHLSQSMQMMRDRPFSQEVLRDWNAEESEASEAEEDG